MLITKEITIDFLRRGIPEPLEAVQCDANTRAVKVTLLNGGESWTPPAGAVPSVAFKKPDGTSGWYDKLPDGKNACTVTGNTVTAIFAPQMLTAAGKVHAAVIFQDSKLNQLATFVFTVQVQANPAAGGVVSNNYYKYSTMEDVNEAVDAALASLEEEKQEFLTKAEAALKVVHGAATEDAPAIVCEESGAVISVSDASDRLLHGLTIYGKTTQNGTPTPSNPVELDSVGASGTVRVGVYGKNLLDSSKFSSATVSGVQFSYNNATGGVNVKGTSTAYANRSFEITDVLGPGTYTISASGASGVYAYVRQYYVNAESITTFSYSSNNNFTVDGTERKIDVFIQVNPNDTVDGTAYIQIESGNKATAFEPYNGQTLTASTPNGLPGIPVSSGGNYTDKKGQAWLCDEIDFAKGVYVQRVGRDTFNGSESTWSQVTSGGCCRVRLSHAVASTGYTEEQTKLMLCDRLQVLPRETVAGTAIDGISTMGDGTNGYAYLRLADVTDLAEMKTRLAANPVSVLYIPSPAIAVETPLPAEELAAFAALHSNKPNTTVLNGAGAGMKLAYVADTKIYIDNKFSELAAALVHNT